MNHASTETLVQLMLWIGILMGLVVIAAVVVQKFRGGAAEKAHSTHEALTNFQEMHARGDISEADYRKIKSVLGAELHGELKDGKNKL